MMKNKLNPWIFSLLVFIFSVPFWLIGMIADHSLQKVIPINLPFSALMFICPMIAAFVLVYRNQGPEGVKQLIKSSIYLKNIKILWYIPIFFLMPIIMILAYGLLRLMGISIPNLQFSIFSILVLFFIFLFAGICEEIGWQGYAYGPLENQWNALLASLILGMVWQVWHIVPHFQAHHPPDWILWQFASSVLMRVLIVWLYKNTKNSIFAAALFHAMNNVCSFLIPNYDSSYVPFSVFIVTAFIVVIVIFLWGPRTLSRYKWLHSR